MGNPTEASRKRKKANNANASPNRKHAFTKRSIDNITAHVSPVLQRKARNIVTAYHIENNNGLLFTMNQVDKNNKETSSYTLPLKQMMDEHNPAIMKDLGCQSAPSIRGENGEAKTPEGKNKKKIQ